MELPIILAVIVLVLIAFGVRIVSQYEKAVVFTLGKFSRILEPGFNVIVPFIQRSTKVDIRERAVDVPSQDAITKDNISLNVNAVIYYKIDDVAKSIINVRSLEYAIMQFAMTTMRNSIGQFDLDELLSKREEAGKKIMEIVENKSQEW
jgi:regulator of protease activity HflC (stomatin/prohibitin superfamily)